MKTCRLPSPKPRNDADQQRGQIAQHRGHWAYYGGLIADANGDLVGTTSGGGADGDGSVFEITGSGFIPAPAIAIAGTVADQTIQPSTAWVRPKAASRANDTTF